MFSSRSDLFLSVSSDGDDGHRRLIDVAFAIESKEKVDGIALIEFIRRSDLLRHMTIRTELNRWKLNLRMFGILGDVVGQPLVDLIVH